MYNRVMGKLQRQHGDCAVAAIATVTRKSYTFVKRTCGTTRGGLDLGEIGWLLGEMDVNFRVGRSKLTADQWAARNPGKRAVLVVADVSVMWGGDMHAVAAVDGKIFNPADGAGCGKKIHRVFLLMDS